MPREAQTERERRMTAVGRDRRTRAELALGGVGRALAADDHASHESAARCLLDDRTPYGHVRFEHRASSDGAREQRPIDVAAHERTSDEITRITALDSDAVLAGETHPAYGQSALLDRRRQPEPPQQLERAGIHGVAA